MEAPAEEPEAAEPAGLDEELNLEPEAADAEASEEPEPPGNGSAC